MRRALALLVPLLVVTALPACTYRVVRFGEIDESVAERIVTGIEEIRGLRFTRRVPMDVGTPDALRRELVAILDRDFAPDELADLSRAYRAIGLLEPDVDLREALLELYTAQVAGFYDPESERLHLVDPPQVERGWMIGVLEFLLRRDLVGEMLLAHELTHALQDQHTTALSASDDPGEDDRSLAIRAVIEGDATLAGFAYVLGGLEGKAVLDLVHGLGAVPAELARLVPDAPRLLRDVLVFQYSDGARFVSEAYRRGGWPAVDALLRHPPRSTEQVLHPERFYGRPDAPSRVSLGGIEDYRTGGAWRLLEENTLGELVVRILFEEHLPAERAWQAATGWDGDRFAAFAEGDRTHVFWMSVWDRERDAEEFADALREVLTDVHGAATTADGGVWRIEQRGDRVLAVVASSDAPLGERAAKIWAETAIEVDRVEMDLDVGRAGDPPAPSAEREALLAPSGTADRPLALELQQMREHRSLGDRMQERGHVRVEASDDRRG